MRNKSDTQSEEQLKASAAAAADAAIAKEAGFSISADNLKPVQQKLSEEELENVAGGKCTAGSLYQTGVVDDYKCV